MHVGPCGASILAATVPAVIACASGQGDELAWVDPRLWTVVLLVAWGSAWSQGVSDLVGGTPIVSRGPDVSPGSHPFAACRPAAPALASVDGRCARGPESALLCCAVWPRMRAGNRRGRASTTRMRSPRTPPAQHRRAGGDDRRRQHELATVVAYWRHLSSRGRLEQDVYPVVVAVVGVRRECAGRRCRCRGRWGWCCWRPRGAAGCRRSVEARRCHE